MSNNQKQTATGGPQTQRFSNSPYQSISQAGGRPDGYPVSNQGYVPQQNQGGNQGPGLRGIPPNGPPNQASTPPNAADLKVQALTQPPMSHMFVQPQVRSNQGPYYPRTPGPSNQPHRMPNHNNRAPQAMYGTAQTQYMSIPVYLPQANTVQFYGQRPGFVQQAIPMYAGQHMPAYQFNATPTQAAPVGYFYNNQIMGRPGPIPPTQPATPNPTQAAMPNVPMVTNPPQHQPFQRQQTRKRPNAVPIIDPNTGNEIFEQSNSHPPSGESSARQTPQPALQGPSKEVAATFAKQVLQALGNDGVETNVVHHMPESTGPSHPHHRAHQEAPAEHHHHHQAEQQVVFQQPPPLVGEQAAQMASGRLENIVQTSNLKVQAKEFVLSNSPKDTPIVSANCDSVEVTLPNKSPKDRESPAKSRKQQQQQQREQPAKEQKETPKEVISVPPSKEVEKPTVVAKEVEVKTREVVQSSNPPTVSAPSPKESVKDSGNQEKRSHKKESKAETKAVEQVESVATVPVAAQPTPVVQELTTNNAKSKQNAQRAQKQAVSQNNNNQKANQAPVPQPQPTKPSNKSHKKNEINMKGANKEGTDMDAFNDNVVEKEEVNANTLTNSNHVNNDVINANSVTNTVAPQPPKEVVSETKTKAESIEAPTIKAEPVKPMKTKIDITDIVKEKPKPIKPFTAIENHDETDRASVPAEKLVQAKNDVNANSKSVDSNGCDKSLYKEGQFSPWNLDGKTVYHRELLMALRDVPASRVRPDNIPDVVLADDRGRVSDGRASMGGRTDFMNPPFTNYGGKSSSRGPAPKRNSQSKMGGGGGGQKAGRPTVKVSISVREDVKLHESENAWRPARLNKGDTVVTEDDTKTAELYKKVRGVLNKLTPQKFDTLLSQIKALNIDTMERLQGVIDLVFEKAVDEPNFSVAYALMCKELALMQVPTAQSTPEKPDFVNFRKLLITRCQVEFEKQSVDESVRNDKVKEIDECNDPEKKKDLQFELEEYDRRLRMKSVGNIRFIGELFKKGMLTVNIMMRCLGNLLEHKDEESLECLCKLLTTIGKELESNSGVNLSQIFGAMKAIVDKRDGKVSSRIRFMLQDVIDLRNSKWVPRRQDLNPKTIEQIQKEADSEQLNIQLMNSVPMTPRKDERMGPGPNADRKGGRGGRNVSSDDGWIVNTNRNRTPFSVQSDKLKSKAPLIDEPLGSSQLFGNWGKGSIGSTIKTQMPAMGVANANMYAPLENISLDDKRLMASSGRSGSKDPYSSKGPSLERNFPKYDGRGSRSGSQQRSNDLPPPQRAAPSPAVAPPVSFAPPKLPPQQQQAPAPAPAVPMSPEHMERRINNALDEYVTGSCSVDFYFDEVSTAVPTAYFSRMIEDSYLRVLEKSQQARSKTGGLFAQLVKDRKIQIEDYCGGLEAILSQADDLKIDIPKIWDYLAEIIVDLICEEVLPLSRLHKSCQILISQGQAAKLLAPLFKLVVREKGPNFLHGLWLSSGLRLSDFMPASQVDAFVKDNQFEFLVGGNGPVGQNQASYEQIQAKLLEFLKAKKSFDDTVNWITANVGDRVKECQFIKALATAIFMDSISSNLKLVPETLSAHNNLLLKYVDNNATYELQCLYALQALIHKLEHPQGLLLSICDKLYELGTFSQESFIAWENSSDPAEQEGKGVALKQLTCFFTQLKENDEEEYGSSTSDEA